MKPRPAHHGGREHLRSPSGPEGPAQGILLVRGASWEARAALAAEVAAGLGRPLQRVALSQVLGRYIGETEKNLARVFDAAEASEVILFFDEADALFGKRSDVADAEDRDSNPLSEQLLRRMERHRGLCILAARPHVPVPPVLQRRIVGIVDPAARGAGAPYPFKRRV